MSQDKHARASENVDAPVTTPPTAGHVEEVPTGAPADAPTIGTGTSIALGCVAGTILLILIGLIYILILALL